MRAIEVARRPAFTVDLRAAALCLELDCNAVFDGSRGAMPALRERDVAPARGVARSRQTQRPGRLVSTGPGAGVRRLRRGL
jgi:hypothetical protein